MRARYLLSGVLSNVLQSGIPAARDNANIDPTTISKSAGSRASDDEIELRNKPMTYQISNVDLSAVSVSIRERSDDVAIFSIHAEPRDNDKTSASS